MRTCPNQPRWPDLHGLAMPSAARAAAALGLWAFALEFLRVLLTCRSCVCNAQGSRKQKGRGWRRGTSTQRGSMLKVAGVCQRVLSLWWAQVVGQRAARRGWRRQLLERAEKALMPSPGQQNNEAAKLIRVEHGRGANAPIRPSDVMTRRRPSSCGRPQLGLSSRRKSDAYK